MRLKINPMPKYIIYLLLVLSSQFLYSQNQDLYSRVRISLVDQDIRTLTKLGIEADHGLIANGKYIESDYSQNEINKIIAAGFKVETIIPDLNAFYSDPKRPSMINPTGFRFGNCLNTPTDLYSYKTPANYKYGSMGGYLTFDEMLDELDKMAFFYPNLITIRAPISNFETNDGNSIYFLKISDHADVDESDEPQILYTGLHHAREPNSMSQLIFYMWYLLENYGKDPEVTTYVNSNEMYFIPCVNPDGYIYNQISKPNGGGLWRKNTSRDGNGKLIGVDLNRNYGYFWGYDNGGSSPNQSDETYRGPAPFSEVETQAIKYMCEHHQFELALNYHTFGNLLIHPWGYNDLPTDEDLKFKAIGREINKENLFTLGTGTETVGYITNGDSDDYMYGDQTEKNKIYAFTPEVGPSFWPKQNDIDFLNRSCMNMNLSLPRLISNYSDVSIINKPVSLSDEVKQVTFQVLKKGIKGDDVSLSISADNDLITFNVENKIYTLNSGESDIFEFNFDYKTSNISNGDEVSFYTRLSYDNIVKSDTFTFIYLTGSKESISNDNFESESKWIATGSWAPTTLVYNSPSSSMTDSPGNSYQNNASSSLTLIDTIDLSDAKYADISFAAKWAIEDNFDYVQVLASSDGLNFEPLCGKYTNSGSSDQIMGQPLYDGVQSTWVNETLDLNDFLGEQNVFIKIEFKSDGFLQMDGFYFDDFSVNVIRKTTRTQNLLDNIIVNAYPNPAFDVINVKLENSSSIYKIRMMNTEGRVLQTAFNDGQIDVSNLNNGFYLLNVENKDHQQYYAKMTIAR